MKFRVLRFYFIVIFCLSSVLFFKPLFLSDQIVHYIYYAILTISIITIIINHQTITNNNDVFSAPILLLLVAIVISGFSASFSWQQDLIDSFKALSLYLSYLLFFLLVLWKTSIEDVEKIIFIFGGLYIIIFSVTFLLYPLPIFGDIQQYSDDRGFQRIAVIGEGNLFFFSFYSLNQYVKKQRFLWLIYFLISVICIIMLLTRTLIVVSSFVLILFMLHKSTLIKKILVALLVLGSYFTIAQMNFFQIMVEKTLDQSENIDEDVRVLSATFYLNEFSPNIFSRIFGNGEDYEGSRYSREKEYIQTDLDYYQSDIGYIGLYSKFGILAIFAYLILIYRVYKVSIPEDYLYCKYYLSFIFIISIIINAPFNPGYLTSIVFAIYILNSKHIIEINKKVSKDILFIKENPTASIAQKSTYI